MNSPLSPETLAQLDQHTHDYLAESGNCAQTSFAVLEDYFHLDGQQTRKALAVLPGVALRGETCGAVLGCLMAIGLTFGPEKTGDRAAFLASLPPARRFCRTFEAEAGSTMCAELLKIELGQEFDLSRSTDFAEYVHCGGIETCAGLVSRAVQLAAAIMTREMEEGSVESGMWYA